MALKPTSTGVRGRVGMSGAGKTFSIRRDVFAAVRGGVPMAILDIPEEWNEVPRDLAPSTVKVDNVAHALEALESSCQLVILQLDADPDELVAAAEALGGWAMADTTKPRGLAIPEAHNVAPSKSTHLPKNLGKIMTAWRHRKVCFWWDTQRISLISRTMTELVRELHLYAIAGDRDLRVVRDLATDGDQLVAAVREAAVILSPHDPDDPDKPECVNGTCKHTGWHVKLDMARLPPFELVRE